MYVHNYISLHVAIMLLDHWDFHDTNLFHCTVNSEVTKIYMYENIHKYHEYIGVIADSYVSSYVQEMHLPHHTLLILYTHCVGLPQYAGPLMTTT